MKKNLFSALCIATSMLLVVSVGSVIGIDQSTYTTPTIPRSPLFYTQTCRYTDTTTESIGTTYIGMDTTSTSFGFTTNTIYRGFDQSLTLLQKHPRILTKILPLLCTHEIVTPILEKYDINIEDIHQQIQVVQNNPHIFDQIVEQYRQGSSPQNPSTLGLNSTNPLAIIILLIALLPVLVTLVLVIATVTIITCFNIAGCFETIFNGIVYGFINGLTPA